MDNVQIEIVEKNGSRMALVNSADVVIQTPRDALDLLGLVSYQHGCEGVVVPKACITEDFFDLKTGIAGEILQKYTNYHMKIAIVGDFSIYPSKALRDFIRESNRGSTTFFVATQQEGMEAMLGLAKEA